MAKATKSRKPGRKAAKPGTARKAKPAAKKAVKKITAKAKRPAGPTAKKAAKPATLVRTLEGSTARKAEMAPAAARPPAATEPVVSEGDSTPPALPVPIASFTF
jgi:hypothetical protein